MSKKGLSAVIGGLILILLVVVAVGIIWFVISNFVGEAGEGISLDEITLNMEIQKVTLNEDNIDVQVERDVGQGELSGLKFIVSDGENSESFEEDVSDFNEYDVRTFTLDYTGLVKSVEVAPIRTTDKGNQKTGSVSDVETLEHIGLVHEIISDSTCTELGWPDQAPGGTAECGESDSGLGGCNSDVGLLETMEICEGAGGRLCTLEEIIAGEIQATGCDYDNAMIWTSTECGDEGFYLARGFYGTQNYCEENLDATEADTSQVTIELIGVRCCGDE